MKITSRIHAIKIPFQIPVAPGKTLDRFVYSYLIAGSETKCLIDSGVAGAEGIILDYLGRLGLAPEDIALLLLTHAHPDHIGAARAIRDRCRCRVAAHASARAWIEDTETQFRERPVPGFHELVGGPTGIDRALAHNDLINLGAMSLRVIHTPGHSRCSISLFCEEEKILFSGDAIPQGNDLPIYEDVAVAGDSIMRLQKTSGVENLLASWSDPQPDADPYRIMADGLTYLQRIHTAMRGLPDRESLKDPMNLCRKMVDELGLPEVAINPLIARSFCSHLPLLDRDQLFTG